MPDYLVEILNEPLPEGAVEPHPTKSYLSSIKAIFVIERLNQVFGIGGWTYTTRIIENEARWEERRNSRGEATMVNIAQVVIKVVLKVPAFGIRLEQFGGSDNEDRGDAYKGAVTDALSKIGSYLGIAMDVYKGGGPTKQNPRGRAVPKPVRSAAAEHVAAQKIAAGNAASPAPWNTMGEMRRMFAAVREQVGETAFSQELDRWGWRSFDDLRTAIDHKESKAKEKAVECFEHLAAMLRKGAA